MMTADNEPSTMGLGQQMATMGAGMAPAGAGSTEMGGGAQPELHTLNPEQQRAAMGLPPEQPPAQQPGASALDAAEIARREEALKRGGNP